MTIISKSNSDGMRCHHSKLLTAEENQMVTTLVGPRCQALATTVAQVYRSEGPGHAYRWNKRTCGVVCFIKDNMKRSYFIRVFDMDGAVLVFDQEIYNQFRYKAPRPYFHTFEGDETQIGLNFVDEDEAATFQATVEAKLAERRERREKRQAGRKQQTGRNGGGAAVPVLPSQSAQSGGPLLSLGQNKRGDKRGGKRRLNKEDIGMPTNFQHISHVGWDPNHGFDLENVDPNLKKFFHKAGVDEKALQDKDTREFIYDFIDKHGGVEAALREVNNSQGVLETLHHAPPPPPRSIVPTSLTPPPPPSRTQSTAPPPPPPTNRTNQRAPPPPAPPQHPVKTQSVPSFSAPPPPPPPPPPPSGAGGQPGSLPTLPPGGPPSSLPTLPPAAPTMPPPDTDTHSSLLDEIRRGGTLRHVSPEKTTKPNTDVRGDLMAHIRQGVALKKVEQEKEAMDSLESLGEIASCNGIAGMLQRALQERGMVMGMSSSEDDTEGEEEEWED